MKSFYVVVVKRILDLVLSLIMLPFFLVILICVGIAIKLEDGGPIFYNAPRMGKDMKPFKMYKFRSMKVNAPDIRTADGSTYNSPTDERLTKVGSFIRKTSLDETPQVLNILIGNMSWVGPRPDDLKEAKLYEGEEYRKTEVLPGITGYAQAYYRNAIPFKERIAHDLYYVDNISFALDAKIFFHTIKTVFSQEGVYVQDGSEDTETRGATRPELELPKSSESHEE